MAIGYTAILDQSSRANQLENSDFAGNVRELRNVLERAVTLAETSDIDISHLGLPDCEPSDNNSNCGSTANQATGTD